MIENYTLWAIKEIYYRILKSEYLQLVLHDPLQVWIVDQEQGDVIIRINMYDLSYECGIMCEKREDLPFFEGFYCIRITSYWNKHTIGTW